MKSAGEWVFEAGAFQDGYRVPRTLTVGLVSLIVKSVVFYTITPKCIGCISVKCIS